MLTVAKKVIQKSFNALGYEVVPKGYYFDPTPVELTKDELRIADFILNSRLTMVPKRRLVATILACKYIADNGIEGDFVESGVWRGGNSIAAKLVFQLHGLDKRAILFDTFAGMTAPCEADRSPYIDAHERFTRSRRDDHNDWCYASLEEVIGNFEAAGIDLSGVTFVQGDVTETLSRKENLPERISLLRLDTDFYQSTKAELENLYPRLVPGGVLIIDDYGHWDGCRKAVDEYFSQSDRPCPFLQYVDYAARMTVKTSNALIAH